MERTIETTIDVRPPELRVLVDRYRSRCLWFLAAGYYPRTRAEILRVVEYLERYGDRESFHAAASIRQWLSRHSSDTSAAR